MNKLLIRGYKKPLEINDLGNLPQSEWAIHNYSKFSAALEEEKRRTCNSDKSPSLWRCYVKAFWPMMALGAAFKLSGDLLSFVGPLCIRYIVLYVEEKQAEDRNNATKSLVGQPVTMYEFFSNGYVLAVTVFLVTVIQHLLLQNHNFVVIREAIRLRASIQTVIYRKALHLSPWMITSDTMTTGSITNHVSVDSNHLMYLFYFGHYMWATPLKIIVTLVLLYLQLGYSALIGSSMFLILSPLQLFLASCQSKIQKKTLQYSDERIKRSNEILQSIRLLKLFAWETLFCHNVNKVRRQEMKWLLRSAMLRAGVTFITEAAPVVITLVTFSIYPYIERQPLTPARAFTGLALFDLLTIPLFMMPMIIHTVVNAAVSTKRLLPYLLAPEVESYMPRPPASSVNSTLQRPKETKVSFQGGSHRTAPVIMIVEPPEHSGEGEPLMKQKNSQDSTQNADTAPVKPPTNKFYLELNGTKQDTVNVETPSESPWPSPFSSPETSPLPSPTLKRPEHTLTQDAVDKASIKKKVRRSASSLSDYDDKDRPTSPSRRKSSLAIGLKAGKRKRKVSSVSLFDEEMLDPSRGVGMAVEVSSGHFSWDPDSTEPILHDINLKIPCGQLTIIVGKVGCGKSSLISALLKEMTTISGSVMWKQGVGVAYAAQTPWLMNATLQDNILFGLPMDKKRYKRVIQACALQPDINILPAGDLTEIGEKGINLSGGQKQRVSVARAMYSTADILLLDDPMSALDVHVGTHLFEDGVLRLCLKRKRTVVLITHQLQYLKNAHKIINMADGRITHEGNLMDIKGKDPELFQSWQDAIKHFRNESAKELTEPAELGSELERAKMQRQLSMEYQRTRSLSIAVHNAEGSDTRNKNRNATSTETDTKGNQQMELQSSEPIKETDEKDDLLPDKDKGKLMQKEERVKGVVSWRIYFTYIQACSWLLVVIFLTFQLTMQAARVATNFWLSWWSQTATDQAYNLTTNTSDVPSVEYYIQGYAVLSTITVVVSLVAALASVIAGYRASIIVHKRMLYHIIKVPMRFFDTTPVGRIINRFSGDTNTIDDKLPHSMESIVRTLLVCVVAAIVNAIATPYFLAAVIPILIVYYFLQNFFRASSRELQRLDSITKSPVFAHLAETLGGLSTIRAYRDEKRFRQTLLHRIDTNNTAFLYLQTANRWLGIRLDCMGAVIVFIAAVSSVSVALQGYIQSAMVGLCIAYAIMMSSYLNFVVRSVTDAETYMNAVERVVHYSELPIEPYTAKNNITVPSNWPSEGAVSFNKVSLRYDDTLQPVVHDVTLHITAKHKVGVCGRTGSGKSSLTLGLFRMIDICQGEISIDGINICKIDLETLRSNLSIIPQDPSLFSGSVRFNLDPSGEKTDKELWSALDVAQLKQAVTDLPQKLDSEIAQGGENFSVGQRQLFCLARAFLKESRLIVMDEATASIDIETDTAIQEVISTAFRDKTLITIAHRVSTILDSDMVIVMDDGHMIEYDTPQNLLVKEDGLFTSLVKENK